MFKASTTIFHIPTTQGSAFCPILHRVLVLPKQSFNDFIRHQFQALIFVKLFIKKKFRALRRPAEASQRSRKTAPIRLSAPSRKGKGVRRRISRS